MDLHLEIIAILEELADPISSNDLADMLSSRTGTDVTGGATRRALHDLLVKKRILQVTGPKWFRISELNTTSKQTPQPHANLDQASKQLKKEDKLRPEFDFQTAPKSRPRKKHIAPPYGTIKSEFAQALLDEVEHLKKTESKSIFLVQGLLVGQDLDSFQYKFRIEGLLISIDDSPAQIEIGKDTIDCIIVTVQNDTVTVSLRSSYGQHIESARLKNNRWQLLEMLRKKYEELPAAIPADFQSSETLFAGKNTTQRNESQYINISDSSLNQEQQRAVKASLNNSLTIIWGPPGTGKTHTIAAAVKHHLDAGRRILILSHSNAAVDQALYELAEHCEESGYYKSGQIVRLGKSQKADPEKEQRFPLVLVSKIQEARSVELSARRRQIANELDHKRMILQTLTELSVLNQRLAEIESQEKKLDIECQRHTPEVEQLQTRVFELQTKLSSQTSNSGFLGQAARAANFLTGNSPKKLQKQLQNTLHQLGTDKEKLERNGGLLKELSKQKSEIAVQIVRRTITLEKLVKQLAGDPTSTAYKTNALEQDLKSLSQQIAAIDAQLSEMETSILNSARVIATTLTKTFSHPKFPGKFDVMVLDEASMAPLPFVYWAAHCATEFMTIVGDFKQLPPIGAASKSESAKKWLDASIFDILSINTSHEAEFDSRVVLLNTQYRMIPDISRIPNKLFYNNLLKDGPGTSSKSFDSEFFGREALHLIDTSSAGPYCTQLPEKSRLNLYHAMTAAKLAEKLLNERQDRTIGIVAPYRPHCVLIRKIISDWTDPRMKERIQADTVHSFQGGERDIIIFDCVDTNGSPNFSMLDSEEAELLLNVAITRAKSKLFLVADKKFMAKRFTPNSFVGCIFSYFLTNARQLASSELVREYQDLDFEKWVLAATEDVVQIDPNKGLLATHTEFWPLFLADLKTAEHRIILMSAFIARRRYSQLLPYFYALRQRDVAITIHTRPLNEHRELTSDASEFFDFCTKNGINIVQRTKMHEKVIIIDNDILWEGSLNVLSHNNSTELMRRLPGQNAIAEVLKRLDLNSQELLRDQILNKKCPRCSDFLVVRQSKKGLFVGCKSYPGCTHTEQLPERR